MQREVAQELRNIFHAPDLATAQAWLIEMVKKYQSKYIKLADWLELTGLSRAEIAAGFVSVVDLQQRVFLQSRPAVQLFRWAHLKITDSRTQFADVLYYLIASIAHSGYDPEEKEHPSASYRQGQGQAEASGLHK
jgi:hypothetical protein